MKAAAFISMVQLPSAAQLASFIYLDAHTQSPHNAAFTNTHRNVKRGHRSPTHGVRNNVLVYTDSLVPQIL